MLFCARYAVERKRRFTINDKINELASLLPIK